MLAELVTPGKSGAGLDERPAIRARAAMRTAARGAAAIDRRSILLGQPQVARPLRNVVHADVGRVLGGSQPFCMPEASP